MQSLRLFAGFYMSPRCGPGFSEPLIYMGLVEPLAVVFSILETVEAMSIGNIGREVALCRPVIPMTTGSNKGFAAFHPYFQQLSYTALDTFHVVGISISIQLCISECSVNAVGFQRPIISALVLSVF